MRRWLLGLVALAIVVAVAAWTLSSGETQAADDAPADRNFSEVVRTDLIDETEYDGTLGRLAGDAVTAPAPGVVTSLPDGGDVLTEGDVLFEVNAEPVILLYGDIPQYRTLERSADYVASAAPTAGVVTYIAEPGTVLEQGDVLYEIDEQPVVLLYGDAPTYRRLADLSTNLVGDDVAQLEAALDALGFVSAGEMTVDDEFTGATAGVVEEWQDSLGAEEDGVVELGEVVFTEGPTQVATTAVSVGDTVSPNQPVLAVSGSAPMVGPDVEALEVSLVSLGYATFSPDSTFDEATAEAVKAMESDLGLTVDGRLETGEVVVLPDSIRVSATTASLGGTVNAGSPMLAVTGEDSVVLVNLPAGDQGNLEEGTEVTVELPDQSEVPGRVTNVATVATVANNATVFEVEIVLDDPSVAAGLDEAPVDVFVITDSVEDVMAVPVAALLALREGGYAVEVEQGSGTQLVAVDPGFFADGMVEIDADGIEPGDRVVVP